MIFTIEPSSLLKFIIAGIALIAVLSVFLKKGDWKRKITAIIITAAISILLLFFFGRETELRLDEAGLESDSYGRMSFSWEEVDEARLIKNYMSTAYKPALKINGIASGDFKAGSFTLKNGEKARILIGKSADAVLFRTGKGLFLIGIEDMTGFTGEASKYTDIKELPPAAGQGSGGD